MPKGINLSKWDWNDARKHQVEQLQKVKHERAVFADYGREMA